MNGQLPATEFDALGCRTRLVVTDRRRLDQATRLLRDELRTIDETCSRFRPDSELSLLDERSRVTPLLAEAVAVALRAARLTDGDLDPTVGRAMAHIGYDRDFTEIPATGPTAQLVIAPVPGWRCIRMRDRTLQVPPGVHLDLGATAKALAVDRAVRRLGAALDCGVLVSIGGDLAVTGPAPDKGWSISVQDTPDGTDGPQQTVSIRSGAVATSSTAARRWVRGERVLHHILDPRTGVPATTRWRTVSVAAGNCVDANIAATTAVIRSTAAPEWLSRSGLPARFVDNAGDVATTHGWPA